MNTELDFGSYEQALAIKELGFKETCIGLYNIRKKLFNKGVYEFVDKETNVLAPLKNQIFRWFREKYDIHYSIDRECSQHDHKWGYNWSLYNYTGIFDEYLTSHPNAPAGEWIYETYEEAENACIDKLIELIKTQQQ